MRSAKTTTLFFIVTIAVTALAETPAERWVSRFRFEEPPVEPVWEVRGLHGHVLRFRGRLVLERFRDLFMRRGTPHYLGSANGGEFTAEAVRNWVKRLEVKTLYIEPGSPWENGYIESFNG